MKTQQVHTVTQFRCFGQIWKLLEPMHITTEKGWEVEAYYCFDRSREVYGSSPSDRSEDVIPTVMNDLGLNLYGVCEAYIYPKDFHEERWENQQVLESMLAYLSKLFRPRFSVVIHGSCLCVQQLAFLPKPCQ